MDFFALSGNNYFSYKSRFLGFYSLAIQPDFLLSVYTLNVHTKKGLNWSKLFSVGNAEGTRWLICSPSVCGD